ncbi:MAG TPA: tetratricopeptide repeat protein [Reyranellaceae bacterium]|nr:tetratricopeptide repeat protein [Reyranellaceae bacterium]
MAALDGCSLAIPRELSTTSDIFDALLSGAKAARERGDLAKALTDLDEAVKRRPQSALAHYLRGLTLGDRGELERAVDALDFAIRLKGDFTEAMRARGFAQYKRREFIFALEDFARVLPKNPTDVEIVAARGDMYVRMGDWDKALAELNRELALRPGHYLAVARRGDAWRGKGRTDAALNEYALAARLAPGYWPVRHARAVIYEERREYDKALAEYDAVRRHSPRHAPSLAQRCGIKTILDRLAEALPDCEAALQGHGRVKDDDQVALTWLGLIAYGLGDFVRAREMLDGAIAQKGAWPRANYARALLRETLGDTSGSFRDMTAARRYTESPADWERVQVELSRFRRGPWCHVPMPCGTIPAGSIKSDGCGCGP